MGSQRTKRSSHQMIESPVAVNPLKSSLISNNEQRLASSESCEKLRKIGENEHKISINNEKFPKSLSISAITSPKAKCKLQQNARKRCYPAESPISISKHLDFKKLRI